MTKRLSEAVREVLNIVPLSLWKRVDIGPLSLRERVRVRAVLRNTVFPVCVSPQSPHPLPLSQGRGEFPDIF
jgi:hypothetical protein